MTPFIGVRISWLVLAMNSDFARADASARIARLRAVALASSRRALSSRNSISERIRSVTSRNDRNRAHHLFPMIAQRRVVAFVEPRGPFVDDGELIAGERPRHGGMDALGHRRREERCRLAGRRRGGCRCPSPAATPLPSTSRAVRGRRPRPPPARWRRSRAGAAPPAAGRRSAARRESSSPPARRARSGTAPPPHRSCAAWRTRRRSSQSPVRQTRIGNVATERMWARSQKRTITWSASLRIAHLRDIGDQLRAARAAIRRRPPPSACCAQNRARNRPGRATFPSGGPCFAPSRPPA